MTTFSDTQIESIKNKKKEIDQQIRFLMKLSKHAKQAIETMEKQNNVLLKR